MKKIMVCFIAAALLFIAAFTASADSIYLTESEICEASADEVQTSDEAGSDSANEADEIILSDISGAYLSDTDTCSLVYDYTTNGGSYSTSSNMTVKYGANADLTVTAVKSGWEFVGWNTDKNATTALTTYRVTKNSTLYAIFKRTVTARFYSKNNELQVTKTGDIYNNASSAQITAPKPSGYGSWTVEGWRLDSLPESYQYAASAKITCSADADIYAVYSRSIVLSYNKNYGEPQPDSQKQKQFLSASGNKQALTFTLADAILRTGHEFSGWAMNGLDGRLYPAHASIQITDDTTMYAAWDVPLAQTVSKPAITISDMTGGKSASITCATAGAAIYYTTDGSDPAANGKFYTGPISLTSAGTMTVRAIAKRSGWTDSDPASANIVLAKASTPSASIASGTIQRGTQVILSTTAVNETIYYTTNGSTPTTGSTKYTGAITVNSSMTIKAIAVADGYVNSDIAEYRYICRSSVDATYSVSVNQNGLKYLDGTVSGPLSFIITTDTQSVTELNAFAALYSSDGRLQRLIYNDKIQLFSGINLLNLGELKFTKLSDNGCYVKCFLWNYDGSDPKKYMVPMAAEPAIAKCK